MFRDFHNSSSSRTSRLISRSALLRQIAASRPDTLGNQIASHQPHNLVGVANDDAFEVGTRIFFASDASFELRLLPRLCKLSAHARSIHKLYLISDDSTLSREVADSVTLRITDVHTASNCLHNPTLVSIRFRTAALCAFGLGFSAHVLLPREVEIFWAVHEVMSYPGV